MRLAGIVGRFSRKWAIILPALVVVVVLSVMVIVDFEPGPDVTIEMDVEFTEQPSAELPHGPEGQDVAWVATSDVGFIRNIVPTEAGIVIHGTWSHGAWTGVRMISASDGSLGWRQTFQDHTTISVTEEGSLLYVLLDAKKGGGNKLVVLDIDSGEIAWTASGLDRSESLQLKNGQIAYTRDGEGVSFVDALTGESLWTSDEKVGRILTRADDHIIASASSEENEVFAIDTKTGRVDWRMKTNWQPTRAIGIDGSAAVLIYSHRQDGRFGARSAEMDLVRASDGELIWHAADVSSADQIVTDGSRGYMSDAGVFRRGPLVVVAFDLASGRQLWKKEATNSYSGLLMGSETIPLIRENYGGRIQKAAKYVEIDKRTGRAQSNTELPGNNVVAITGGLEATYLATCGWEWITGSVPGGGSYADNRPTKCGIVSIGSDHEVTPLDHDLASDEGVGHMTNMIVTDNQLIVATRDRLTAIQ